MKQIIFFVVCVLLAGCARWSPEQAKSWYSKYKWSAGFNYAPSYAVNEIQMWTKFNPATISQELGYAHNIGFSVLRVFLHVGPYSQNKTSFINNINKFLEIAEGYSHKVVLVLFDDCWKPTFHMGNQPEPIPGIHNSQWVQCPGQNNISETILEDYTKGTINAFRNDQRVVMWDLYNEVGNSGYVEKSLPLTQKIFKWAQTVNPSQPLTSGHWNDGKQFDNINHFILSESDVITFHAYCDTTCTQNNINNMKSTIILMQS